MKSLCGNFDVTSNYARISDVDNDNRDRPIGKYVYASLSNM